jgi:uncharacterized membrane protein YoaK (UPF0700 family)
VRRLRHLTGRHRTASINQLLGVLLAFNAGAINAGGFLAVAMYTSHMTGFVSMVADNLVLGQMSLVLAALGALLSFVAGAATTAILVNWARQRGLHSSYALPLLLEAGLMLVFGLIGGLLNRQTPFAVPLAVLVLAYMMGLQNALVTKVSAAQIRTTHMTGIVTDLGIELGKLVYWNRAGEPRESQVWANRARLRLFAVLLGMFMAGGIVGAAGFKYIGFIWVVPFAMILLLLSLPPLLADLRTARPRAGRA